MKKILLIAPPFLKEKDSSYIEAYPPLGILQIGSYLKSKGIEAFLLDCTVIKNPLSHVKKSILNLKPDIVGIGCIIANYLNAIKISKLIKKIDSRILVVLGGIYPTFADKEVLAKHPEVDIIVRGEGEITFFNLMKAVEKGKGLENVSGISFRRNGKYARNKDQPLIKNLDTLPIPAYDSLSTMPIYKNKQKFLIITSRGCPYKCIFCSTSNYWRHRWRAKSAPKVLEELKILVDKYGAKNILFGDDLFILDEQRVFDICQGIVSKGFKIKWRCSIRADLITQDLLYKMKEAGCGSVFIGVESGKQETLDLINKNQTLSQVVKAREMCKKAKIDFVASFMMGFPWETKADIERTINFAKKLQPDQAAWFIFHPDLGSPIYGQLKNYEVEILDPDPDACIGMTKSVIKTKNLSPSDLEELYLKAILETSKNDKEI